jgi:hypothetical protein
LIATVRPDLWVRAAEIRQEWLEIGLSVAPADHPATEEAIASLYAATRRDRPEFVWVPSPAAALPHLADLPTHRTLRSWVADRRPPGRPPVAGDIAAGLARLRSAVLATYEEPPPDRAPMRRPKGKPWPLLPSDQALSAGLPFHEMVRQGVGEALFRTLADGVYHPIRSLMATLTPHSRDELPVGWYGHQDAAWIAHLDVLRRLGLVSLGSAAFSAPAVGGPVAARAAGSPPDTAVVAGDSLIAAFAAWVALARSGGWWWPGERQCVVVERPTAIRTEPVPGAWHGERLLRHSGTAVEYCDGWFICGPPKK